MSLQAFNVGIQNFSGTSADQDVRYSKDKEKKAIREMEKKGQFPGIYDSKVDIDLVDIPKIRPWIENAMVDIVGQEDEIAVEYCIAQLEGEQKKKKADQNLDPKRLQLYLKTVLHDKAAEFCHCLWGKLLQQATYYLLKGGKEKEKTVEERRYDMKMKFKEEQATRSSHDVHPEPSYHGGDRNERDFDRGRKSDGHRSGGNREEPEFDRGRRFKESHNMQRSRDDSRDPGRHEYGRGIVEHIWNRERTYMEKDRRRARRRSESRSRSRSPVAKVADSVKAELMADLRQGKPSRFSSAPTPALPQFVLTDKPNLDKLPPPPMNHMLYVGQGGGREEYLKAVKNDLLGVPPKYLKSGANDS